MKCPIGSFLLKVFSSSQMTNLCQLDKKTRLRTSQVAFDLNVVVVTVSNLNNRQPYEPQYAFPYNLLSLL